MPERYTSLELTGSRIEMRRQINQHNIESYMYGIMSELCNMEYDNLKCYNAVWSAPGAIVCDRCLHRDDMQDNPDRRIIGFTEQPWDE